MSHTDIAITWAAYPLKRFRRVSTRFAPNVNFGVRIKVMFKIRARFRVKVIVKDMVTVRVVVKRHVYG